MTEVSVVRPTESIEVQLPLIPIGWRILVRPFEHPKSVGEILLPAEALEAEEYLTYVGQIVAMGSQCYKAITRSGIHLAEMDPKPKVGDWIMYGTYGGQKVITKAGAKYLVMNDDGIMGIVEDPASFRAYI